MGFRLGFSLVAVALALTACTDRSAEDEADPVEAYAPPAPRFEPFDYTACEQGAIVPDCAGAECAEDDTEDLLVLFEDAIEAHGVGEYVEVSRTHFHEGQRQLQVEYQVHVAWARSAHVLGLPEDATHDDMVVAIEDLFVDLELPVFLAEPEIIVDALTECIPQVDFEPCTAFESPAVARATVIVTQGDTVDWLARVDTETGTTLTCGVGD